MRECQEEWNSLEKGRRVYKVYLVKSRLQNEGKEMTKKENLYKPTYFKF